MERKIITLGTGSAYADMDRGGPSVLVWMNETTFLFDCGEGTAAWINKLNLTKCLQSVFITHMHPDHVAGLVSLLQNMKLLKRINPLDIFMPIEGINAFKEFLKAVYLDINSLKTLFDINIYSIEREKLLETKTYSIKAWKSDHFIKDVESGRKQRHAFGFTIETNDTVRLVYTGDVSTMDCFKSELKPNTTLICESTHLDIHTMIERAKELFVEKIIFTHIDSELTTELTNYIKDFDDIFAAKDGDNFVW